MDEELKLVQKLYIPSKWHDFRDLIFQYLFIREWEHASASSIRLFNAGLSWLCPGGRGVGEVLAYGFLLGIKRMLCMHAYM